MAMTTTKRKRMSFWFLSYTIFFIISGQTIYALVHRPMHEWLGVSRLCTIKSPILRTSDGGVPPEFINISRPAIHLLVHTADKKDVLLHNNNNNNHNNKYCWYCAYILPDTVSALLLYCTILCSLYSYLLIETTTTTTAKQTKTDNIHYYVENKLFGLHLCFIAPHRNR